MELCERRQPHTQPVRDWNVWRNRGEVALKRTLEVDTSDLAPKYKYCHTATSPQPADDSFGTEAGDHNHNRRCTGTQTSFSSFPHDLYPTKRPPDYNLLELDRRSCSPPEHGSDMHHSRMSAMMSHHRPAPAYPGHRLVPSVPAEDANPGPLNLTTASHHNHHHHNHQQHKEGLNSNRGSTCHKRQSQHSQHRPSVIRQSPYSPGAGPGRASPSHRSSPLQPSTNNTSHPDVRLFILPSDPCGTSIDEHFRRSLGGKYPPAVYGAVAPGSALPASTSPTRSRSPPSPTPAPPAYQLPPEMPAGESTKSNVSITAGTVDDHFARALGDKWKEIKPSPPRQKEPTSPPHTPPPPSPHKEPDILAESVDDHFAKALGDTWLRIKAEKERSGLSKPGSPVSNCEK